MILHRSIRLAGLSLLLALLPGCDLVVMNPSGDVAVQQRDLILISTGLMLLIIVPVMVLTVVFAMRYRKGNDAPYDPDWDHSTSLELVIWSAPLLIIICLGAITWSSTHLLDPYRPLANRANPAKSDGPVDPGQASGARAPLEVQVVALDWKWLFIYPQYGIATVNELAAPVDRPIKFSITASTVMNSFYIPALAGQIYAMPGMKTTLHGVINRPGVYGGISANYSGAGFSDMRFRFRGLDTQGFDRWVAKVRSMPRPLDRATYLALERPSQKEPARGFGAVAPDLFNAVVNMCVRPGQRCVADVMMVDAKGGAGKESAHDMRGLRHDGPADRGALQKEPEAKGSSPHNSKPAAPNATPGKTNADTKTNRDLTLNGLPALPGASVPARS
jgi:cytochrome o ubiquinol oxidase subunit 2